MVQESSGGTAQDRHSEQFQSQSQVDQESDDDEFEVIEFLLACERRKCLDLKTILFEFDVMVILRPYNCLLLTNKMCIERKVRSP